MDIFAAMAIIHTFPVEEQEENSIEAQENSWPYRIYSPLDHWEDTYFIEHMDPYYGDSARETWINDEDPIFGDIGASQD